VRRTFTELVGDDKVEVNLNKYLVNWKRKVGSNFQLATKLWLSKYWGPDLVCEELRIPASDGMRCDLVNISKMIAVEAHGKQHNEYVEHFQKGCRLNWLNQITRDQYKIEWYRRNGFRLIEIEPQDKLSLGFIREKFGIEII